MDASFTSITEESPLIDLKTDLVKALAQTDGHFRTLIELLPVSILVHRSGKIIYANPSWLKLLGYERLDELIGKSPLETVHPEHRQMVRDRIKRLPNSGGHNLPSEEILVRKNGVAVPAEVEAVSVVYKGVPAVMVIARDISVRKKAQESFREAEENLKAILGQIPDAVNVFCQDQILFVNQNLVQMLGYESADELIGRSPWDLIPAKYHAVIQERIGKISGGEGVNPLLEYQWLGKDGVPVDIETSSISIVFGGQRVVMAIGRDISGRKKSQEELRESHFLLEKAQEVGHIGTWTADLSNGGPIVLSRGWYSIFGVDPAGFSEKTESFFSLVHPDDLGLMRKAQMEAVQKGEGFELDFRIVRPGGDLRWVRSKAEVLRDSNGIPAKLIGVTQDVTDRKKAEIELRASEEQFRALFDGAWDAHFLFDDEGLVLDANKAACQLLGLPKEKLLGVPMEKFYGPSYDREAVRKEFFEKGFVSSKARLVRPDGQSREVEFTIKRNVIVGKNYCVARDVTEKIKLERQVFLNDKLATVGTLAAGVAHEINNPLTFVLVNLNSAKERLAELRDYLVRKNLMDSELSNLLDGLREEAEETDHGIYRIRDIVKSLRTFMHPDGDGKEAVEVNRLIDSAINMVFHEIKYKAKVEKTFAVGLPPMAANAGKIHQVLINLLVNAAQAIEPNQFERNRIGVRTGEKNGNILIEVQDTGQGIPEANLKKIFDPFFTTKSVGVGTGLGLFICHQIVQEHGGQILVESQEGKGSLFTLLLPAAKISGDFSRQKRALPVPAALKRILVVDDEPSNVDAFSRVLRDQHEVLFALSGMDALGVLEREKAAFDAIVSDVNMPDMDGVCLYKNVSMKYPGLEKRMVFVTGGVFSTETRDFLKSLSNPLLEKPFQIPDLLKAIAGLPQTA